MCLRLVSQSASCDHGSSFLLQHYFFRRACRDQRKTGAVCLVADARGGKDLYEEKWGKGQTLWVFGSEGLGVSEKALELSDLTLLIPLDSRVESLNVATAASVCLLNSADAVFQALRTNRKRPKIRPHI